MNRDEMLNFLKNEARGISVMFGPNCETIVHDMTRPGHPILAIFNGTVTGREVGSTADIFGDIGDYDESIYQNKDYINQMVLSRDGRTLKSSTFNIVGEDYHFALGINAARGFLCRRLAGALALVYLYQAFLGVFCYG